MGAASSTGRPSEDIDTDWITQRSGLCCFNLTAGERAMAHAQGLQREWQDQGSRGLQAE